MSHSQYSMIHTQPIHYKKIDVAKLLLDYRVGH